MCKKTEKLENFIELNLAKVLKEETKNTLGDRNTYIGASDIGGCPYKVIKSKKNPQLVSLKQNIIFQRGHLAETLVRKMFTGLKIVEQYEATGDFGDIPIIAHIDMLLIDKNKTIILEIKTVSAPIDEPYESWVFQVQLQMGLMMQTEKNIEAYILAIDVNTGWLKAFKIEFDDYLFETCLSKAQHIEDAMLGKCEPKAIIQFYCSTCPYKMECPKQGKFAEDMPHDVAEDIAFIKEAALQNKEAKLRKNRVRDYMVSMGIESTKDENLQSVVTLKKFESANLDIDALKANHLKIYEQYLNHKSSYRLTVL